MRRVCQPLGMREQRAFHPEPVAQVTAAPADAPRQGFVFARDRGGDEFSQLHWFDEQSRETRLLTDGGRNQNGNIVLSADGTLMAYSSTARNGSDRDIVLRDMRTGQGRVLLQEGGSWSPLDFLDRFLGQRDRAWTAPASTSSASPISPPSSPIPRNTAATCAAPSTETNAILPCRPCSNASRR